MLLNALVHRTYMGAHIQLRVYDHKISIWNEGGLPLGLSLDELKREHNSRPRNPIIAKACFMAGYIDTWGRGTLKIINSCKDAGLPEPEIMEKDGGVVVTLLKGGSIGSAIRGAKGGVIDSAIGGAMGGAMNDLTIRQKEILDMIVLSTRISYRALAEHLHINESAVLKHINILKEKGYLKRIGGTRGYWKIENYK